MAMGECTHTPFPEWTWVHTSFAWPPPLTPPSLISLGLMLHFYKRNHGPEWRSPVGKTCLLPLLVWGSCLVCLVHNQSSPRNHQRGSNKRYKKGNWEGLRPLLWGLVRSLCLRMNCLLNKPCLLELSWSVTSILCYDEMRTKGEKLTQQWQWSSMWGRWE